MKIQYADLKSPLSAYVRDLNHLSGLRTIVVRQEESEGPEFKKYFVKVRVEWATEITETEFFGKSIGCLKRKLG